MKRVVYVCVRKCFNLSFFYTCHMVINQRRAVLGGEGEIYQVNSVENIELQIPSQLINRDGRTPLGLHHFKNYYSRITIIII